MMWNRATVKRIGHMLGPPQVSLPQWPAWRQNTSPCVRSPTGLGNERDREDKTAESEKPDCVGGRSWLTVWLSVPASLLRT